MVEQKEKAAAAARLHRGREAEARYQAELDRAARRAESERELAEAIQKAYNRGNLYKNPDQIAWEKKQKENEQQEAMRAIIELNNKIN